MFESVELLAAEQALRLAGELALPVEARSLSHAELTGRQRRLIRFMTIGLVLVAVALLAAVAGELRETPWKALAILAPTALIGGLPLLLAVRWHRQRAHEYRDPGIHVRVDEAGIVIRSAAAAHALGWSEIDAKVESFTGRGGIQFVGATLTSPLGPIRLDNDYYANGRNAAAAVIRGMHGRGQRIS
jgi:hypothetical protein